MKAKDENLGRWQQSNPQTNTSHAKFTHTVNYRRSDRHTPTPTDYSTPFSLSLYLFLSVCCYCFPFDRQMIFIFFHFIFHVFTKQSVHTNRSPITTTIFSENCIALRWRLQLAVGAAVGLQHVCCGVHLRCLGDIPKFVWLNMSMKNKLR